MVVTAVITERLWERWDLDGVRGALADAVVTLAVAVLVSLLVLSPAIRMLSEAAPLVFAAVCALCAAVVGSYRGLRLLELARFAPLAARRSSRDEPAL